MKTFRTDVAGSANALAQAINAVIGKERLAPADYVPELTPPREPSTAGGVRALQRIRLVPAKPGNRAIVAGSVNVKEKSAEVRSFVYVDAVHRRRFKVPVPLVRAEYEAFVKQMTQMLEQAEMRVAVVDTPGAADDEDEEAGTAPASGGSRAVAIALGAVVAVVVLGWLLLR